MLKIGKSSNRRTEREQLFPLFEEVFGITTQTLNDFRIKDIGMIHIKLYHFTRR